MTDLSLPPMPVSFEDCDTLAEKITLLAGQINAANHRLLTLIAEFDTRKGWSGGGTVRSCAHWLNWKCGIALGAGREKVRVAHALQDLPLIDAAFSKGEISYSKVRAMTRVATPQNEDFLLRIARHGTASHVEKAVAKYRSVQCKEAEQEERERDNARKLVYYQDEDGMWVIHAKLPAEAGELVVKAIEAIARPEQEARQQAHQAARQEAIQKVPKNDEENVSAETFEASVKEEQGNHYQELMEHTRADALAKIAEHFIATSADGPLLQGLKGSERCQLVLHVDINTLRQQTNPNPAVEHCHLGDKHWLATSTARRLACDASVITVLEDDKGNVLNVGRKTRTVSGRISRALKERDKTCRFPGCCESRYVDAHHVQHWADGGETSLDNLVTLCRYHHRQLHSGAFSIKRLETDVGQCFEFVTPAGRRIETSVYPQFENVSAETSLLVLGEMAPEVDAGTAVTAWRGEDCDWEMVVEGLLGRESQ